MRSRPAPLALCLLLTQLCACAHYQYFRNRPLDEGKLPAQVPTEFSSSQRSPEILLALAFSGGGTRAAALSYGVLETLARTTFEHEGEQRSLLQEVDLISSVSGGSFTAAYYGLRGEAMFDDFEERFLHRNVTVGLLWRLLFPYNWLRLASPRFNRSDLAAEYYDRILFDEQTFGDLASEAPAIQIQATDLIEGSSFAFVPEQFAPICSEIESYPISRAVAASSAVPVLMSPITLRNYAGTCGYEPPEWMERALDERDPTRRRFHTARRLFAYLHSRRSYIHLIDGGISDNLGIRAPIEAMTLQGGFAHMINVPELAKTRHVVFIIVNAQTMPDTRFGLVDIAPGISQILDMVTSLQINNYNLETIELLRRSIETWDLELRLKGAREGRPDDDRVRFYAIEVSFSAVQDPEERRFLSSLPTSFDLQDATVERLRGAAELILFQSDAFQELIDSLGARMEAH